MHIKIELPTTTTTAPYMPKTGDLFELIVCHGTPDERSYVCVATHNPQEFVVLGPGRGGATGWMPGKLEHGLGASVPRPLIGTLTLSRP